MTLRYLRGPMIWKDSCSPGRLLSAAYIQIYLYLYCAYQRDEQTSCECFGHLRNHWIVTAAMQFYRSISLEAGFHASTRGIRFGSRRIHALNDKLPNELENGVS